MSQSARPARQALRSSRARREVRRSATPAAVALSAVGRQAAHLHQRGGGIAVRQQRVERLATADPPPRRSGRALSGRRRRASGAPEDPRVQHACQIGADPRAALVRSMGGGDEEGKGRSTLIGTWGGGKIPGCVQAGRSTCRSTTRAEAIAAGIWTLAAGCGDPGCDGSIFSLGPESVERASARR